MTPKRGDITRLLPAWGKGGNQEQELFELLGRLKHSIQSQGKTP